MASEQAFLEAIIDEPDDDDVRLIFADWLEEQSDPVQNARGEFIRVQIELAHMAEDDPRRPELVKREDALLDRHREDWLGTIVAQFLGSHCDFVRGLPEHFTAMLPSSSKWPTNCFKLPPSVTYS